MDYKNNNKEQHWLPADDDLPPLAPTPSSIWSSVRYTGLANSLSRLFCCCRKKRSPAIDIDGDLETPYSHISPKVL